MEEVRVLLPVRMVESYIESLADPGMARRRPRLSLLRRFWTVMVSAQRQEFVGPGQSQASCTLQNGFATHYPMKCMYDLSLDWFHD